MLGGAAWVVIGMAGQMNLAVFQHDLTGAIDQYLRVEAPLAQAEFVVLLQRHLGIAQTEPNAGRLGRIKQRLGDGRGHFGFKPLIGLAEMLAIMAREEGGQRQFGKHHQLRPALLGALEQSQHALDGNRPAVGELKRTQLGGGDGEDAGHAGFLGIGVSAAIEPRSRRECNGG